MPEHSIHTGDVETIHFFGTRMRILMSGEQTDGQFCLIEVRSSAGHTVPPHIHRRETETIHVLSGSLTCLTEGKAIAVSAGETALLPMNVPHSLMTGDAETCALLFCTPAGFDAFVRAVGSDTPVVPTPAVRMQVAEVAAQFGIEFVSG